MDSGEAAGGQLPDCAQGGTVLGLPASDPWKTQQIPWRPSAAELLFIPESSVSAAPPTIS